MTASKNIYAHLHTHTHTHTHTQLTTHTKKITHFSARVRNSMYATIKDDSHLVV
jgi:hypothetical protein